MKKIVNSELDIFNEYEIKRYSRIINDYLRGKSFIIINNYNTVKRLLLFLTLFFSMHGYCQDSNLIVKHTQIFSLSPISKKVDNVNGLVFGIGHFDNRNIQSQTINGLNVEINGAPIAGAFIGFISIVYLPEIIKNNKKPDSLIKTGEFIKIKKWDSNLKLKLNGINLTTGCFFTSASMNGLNVSLANKFDDFNGLSLAVLGTMALNQNGISIGLFNGNNNLKGMTIGVMNSSYNLKGSQFGVINYCKDNHGIQIGIFNRSFSKGLQVGIWNVNHKRAMPFINW